VPEGSAEGAVPVNVRNVGDIALLDAFAQHIKDKIGG
jgi:hypothetical protein